MTEVLPPAPLWRRLLAAVYDSLLLLGIWVVALLADVLVRDALGAARNWTALRAYLFGIGLIFFAWFWTHGGQTLGMRAWRLRTQRGDGRALSWSSAAVRYAVMLCAWGIVLAPAFARLPRLRDEPHAGPAAIACAALAAAGLLGMLLDPRRRTPQDWLSGTLTIVLPKSSQGR
ncbi:MAG: RDD family protein [Solimonas sp.]